MLSIKFDSCYLLTKGTNGVKAKFVGTSLLDPKKNAIWVPKNLVTNIQGPSKFGYLKELIFFCRSFTKLEEGIKCLIVGAHNT
jgi:hypothetical protein